MITPERKAKLKWQCRRGMLELDLMLAKFLESQLEKLDDEEIHQLERLLTYQDPDIYSWLMGFMVPDDRELAKIVELIKHCN